MKHLAQSRLWLMCAAGTVLVGCGSLGSSTGGYGLVSAEHTTCAQQGLSLARYLDTGQPTSLDPSYGQVRQQVLTLSGDSRALLIRRTADGAIQQCDQQLDVQASQSAEAASESAAAESAAASSAAAAQRQADVVAQEGQTCQQVGGTWHVGGLLGDYCTIDYTSPGDGRTYHYTVSFDDAGNVVPDACADQAFKGCLGQQESVQQAQADCVSGAANGGTAGTWHADTDICSI